MKIRHHDLEIDNENPFGSCRLDRQPYAEILTNIIGTYADGFVLAINNEWGTGKTTFVKMWQQFLINKGYKTVYFNAWENDFDREPLTAIIAELRSLISTSTQKVFKSVVEKGAAIAKAVLPSALKTVSKGIVDIEAANTAVENLTKAATESFDAEIKDYLKKKESIKAFRSKLEEFVKKTDSEKPIVFFIDELDRCRPDYAVEVLEQMKHFFSVQGIVFVLSIDKEHLSASVRGFYGSESINTDEYLRRFIDLEYSIPKPSEENFCNYLYEYFSFDEFFRSPMRFRHQAHQSDPQDFGRAAAILFQNNNATLRQMEKIFARTRLILLSFKQNNYVLADALFFLVYLSVMRPGDYQQVASGSLTLKEICDLYSSLGFETDERLERSVLLLLARLIVLYSNEFSKRDTKLAKTDSDGKWLTDLHSDLEKNGTSLGEAIHWVYQDFDKAHIKLGFLTNKIELTEALEIQ